MGQRRQGGEAMSVRYALSTIFGLALLPVASMPGSASVTPIAEAGGADEPMVIQLAAKKGGGAHKGGASHKVKESKHVKVHHVNVNKNVHVKRKVYVNKTVNVNVKRGLYKGRHVYTGGTWARPRAYWWPVGGAVTAGAALGFV